MTWDNTDAAQLREFMGKPVGKNLIASLQASIPENNAKSIEETALISKEIKGWQDCINTILANAEHNERPEVETNTFVNTDDSPR